MRSRSFRSVGWVATVAGAALGCYLVSLRVASERAALEDVETKIVMTQRDIRLLQTEIGTRGRLAQLERWNVKVLALSAPSADQFVEGGFALARLTAPEHKVDMDAPVVLASAPVVNQPPAKIIEANYRPDASQLANGAQQASLPANSLMHQASLKQFSRPETAKVTDTPTSKVAIPAPKPAKTATATKPATSSGMAATGDALAPLPGVKPSAKAAKPNPVAPATSLPPLKDSGQAQ